MDDHIKELGETKLSVKVFSGISADITVSVEAAE
jgi:ribosomal protein L9